MGRKECLVKHQMNIYEQHIRQSSHDKHYCTYRKENFICFFFLRSSKEINHSHDNYFKCKFKPLLN